MAQQGCRAGCKLTSRPPRVGPKRAIRLQVTFMLALQLLMKPRFLEWGQAISGFSRSATFMPGKFTDPISAATIEWENREQRLDQACCARALHAKSIS